MPEPPICAVLGSFRSTNLALQIWLIWAAVLFVYYRLLAGGLGPTAVGGRSAAIIAWATKRP